ncbi:MAG TPA: DUF5615 family PIN-like protein [Tepidisphaeraceae bacterium]|jgi:hypothetical protein|nr:DUF5615 family PIN-like protein [Tepidisphaeraceae bacterium]
MPLAYLLDENQRGPLWRYVQRHNLKGDFPVDAIRVGDAPDLPLSSDDRAVLLWAEKANRILVTQDRRTLATHLSAHLAEGRVSPGIFQIRGPNLRDVLEFLVCAAYASQAEEWQNRIVFIP